MTGMPICWDALENTLSFMFNGNSVRDPPDFAVNEDMIIVNLNSDEENETRVTLNFRQSPQDQPSPARKRRPPAPPPRRTAAPTTLYPSPPPAHGPKSPSTPGGSRYSWTSSSPPGSRRISYNALCLQVADTYRLTNRKVRSTSLLQLAISDFQWNLNNALFAGDHSIESRIRMLNYRNAARWELEKRQNG